MTNYCIQNFQFENKGVVFHYSIELYPVPWFNTILQLVQYQYKLRKRKATPYHENSVKLNHSYRQNSIEGEFE